MIATEGEEAVPRALPIAQVVATEEKPPNAISLLKNLVSETIESADSGSTNNIENSGVIDFGDNGVTLSDTAKNVSETFAVFQLLLELGWILVCLSKQFIYHLGDAIETQYAALIKLLGFKKDQLPDAAINMPPRGIRAIFHAVGMLSLEIWQFLSPLVAVMRIILAFLVGLLLFATDQLIFRFIIPADISDEVAKSMKYDLFYSFFSLLVGLTLCFLGGDISTVLVAVSALRSAALATSYAIHKKKQKLTEQPASTPTGSASENDVVNMCENTPPSDMSALVVNQTDNNSVTDSITIGDVNNVIISNSSIDSDKHITITDESKINIKKNAVDMKTPEKFKLPPITPNVTPKTPLAPTSGLLDDPEEVAQQRAKHRRRTLLRQSLGMLDAMKTPLKSPLKPVTPVKPPFSTSMRPPSRRFSLRPTSIRSLTAAFRKESKDSNADDYSRLVSESAAGLSPDVSSKTTMAKNAAISDARTTVDNTDKFSNKENESQLNDVSVVSNSINAVSQGKTVTVANETNISAKESDVSNNINRTVTTMDTITKTENKMDDTMQSNSNSSSDDINVNPLLQEPTDEELRREREEALKHGDMWVALQTLRDDLQDVLLVLAATHHRPDVLRHIHDVLTLACSSSSNTINASNKNDPNENNRTNNDALNCTNSDNVNDNNNNMINVDNNSNSADSADATAANNNFNNNNNNNNNNNTAESGDKSVAVSGNDDKAATKLSVLEVAILVLQTVDPQRLSRALLIVGSRLAAVLLTLRFSFAQTVALSHSLAAWLSGVSHVLLDRFVFPDLEKSSNTSSSSSALNASGEKAETSPTSTKTSDELTKEAKTRRAFRGWMRFLFTCVAHGVSLYVAWSLRRFLATLLAATQGFHYLVQNLHFLFVVVFNAVYVRGTKQETQGTKQKWALAGVLLKTLAQCVALCCAVSGVYIQWRYGWQHSSVSTPGSVATLVLSQDTQHRWALPWVVRWCVAPLLWLERLLLAFVTYSSVAVSSSSLAPGAMGGDSLVDSFSAGTATVTPFASVVMPAI